MLVGHCPFKRIRQFPIVWEPEGRGRGPQAGAGDWGEDGTKCLSSDAPGQGCTQKGGGPLNSNYER